MADTHIAVAEPTKVERSMMEDRMYAFIFPNTPFTGEEKEVFAKAVEYQIAHEKTIWKSMEMAAAIPPGTKSFKIGNFEMTFGDGAYDGPLTRQTICPAAYGILLRVGLMYKGLKRWGASPVRSTQPGPSEPTFPTDPTEPPDIPSSHFTDPHAHQNLVIDGNIT